MIHRIDAATGQAVWSKSVSSLLQQTDDAGAPIDDFVSRNTPIVTQDAVIFGTLRQSTTDLVNRSHPGAFLVAIDKDTAAVKWVTPLHENHPAAVVTGSPVIDGSRLYVGVASYEEAFGLLQANYPCCSFRGSVVAVDVASGAVLWRTHTIRDDVYYGGDGGTLSGYAGAVRRIDGSERDDVRVRRGDRRRPVVLSERGHRVRRPCGVERRRVLGIGVPVDASRVRDEKPQAVRVCAGPVSRPSSRMIPEGPARSGITP